MSRPLASGLRAAGLWGGAATLALAAHLGGAFWVMQRAQAPALAGLPEPVYVELAPAPTAAAPQAAQDSEAMPEAAPQPEPEPEPQPEPEPEPEPEIALPPMQQLEPLPDMNSLFPPPPEAVALPKAVRPPERPEPPQEKLAETPRKDRPKPEKREKKPKAPEEQAARQATTRLRAPQGERSATPQAQAGQPSPRQEASWKQKISRIVARHMLRTRIAGRGGSVVVAVSFSVDPSGRVTGVRVNGSTGDARNDSALQRQASRMPRLPAPPSGRSSAVELPIRIELR
ncbi:energy transducer TonB [Paracoccus sp. (in: a-proteobacteria)]|uniref:energy transducer TonB family protein n=1 Tax=Paracoccus sp. TaxID=267 RepID=UPI00321FE0CB